MDVLSGGVRLIARRARGSRGAVAPVAVALIAGLLTGPLAPTALAAAHPHSGRRTLRVHRHTLVWRPVRHASRYVLSEVTSVHGRAHVVRSKVAIVHSTHTRVHGTAGATVTYRVRAKRPRSSWTNSVKIRFTQAARPAASQAPALTLTGDRISWTPASSQLLGAISTAPRGAAGRRTTYVSISAGASWVPARQPGRTLYYGVEVNGRWSANEVAISWPAAASTAGTTTTTTGGGTTTTTGGGGTTTPTSGGGTTTTTTTSGGGVSGLGSSMLVGLNEADWGESAAADVASSFKIDRMDVAYGESARDFWSRGTAVDMLFSGPYNTGGVSALNATSWAQNALSTFQSQCDGSAVNCPSIEVLNEPYGSWFWGPNASSPTNEAAYAHLLVTTYTLFHAQYGASSPKILAAFSSGSWWAGLTAAVPNIDDYVDGVTVHAYGGTSSVSASALGDRSLVTDAHQTTGKPIWVTEFGWPTALGQPATGDSLQWSDSAQAVNTYDFVEWLRSTGYVAAAMDFNYRDYGTNDFYGVETASGTKKPAWTALAEAADDQACTVCG